jgi:peptidyl-prolyl cis-trans isomerase C
VQNKYGNILALIILFLPGLTACNQRDRLRAFFQAEGSRTAVVKIGDNTYTKTDLDHFFDNRLSEFRDPGNNDLLKSNLLESFIEEKLFLQEAEQAHIQPDPKLLQAMLERAATAVERQGERSAPNRDADLERTLSDSLKTQLYLRNHLLINIEVTDAECEAYYKEHLADYVTNDSVHVREILVDDPAQAQRLLTLLKTNRNKNFADLALAHSKGARADEGGDLGKFQKGELPEEFEKVIFLLAPGNVSKIVRSQYGYHIFMVEEKVLAHQQKLIEVKDQIKEKLTLDREREIIKQELVSLVSRIPVEVYRDRLDFDYIGTRFASPEGSKR